jgi:hypothetical protein
MAKSKAKQRVKPNGKKYGTKVEGILLRVRPEVKEMLVATVDGMNASRRPGDPPYSMTGVILMAIANTFGVQNLTPKEQLTLKLTKGAA